jgi:hypothetical protein
LGAVNLIEKSDEKENFFWEMLITISNSVSTMMISEDK